MDALDQALPALEALKAELDSNPRLAKDFPEACGAGRVWQQRVILLRNGVKIEVFGSGKRMRGLRHGPHRPDLVILDDLENDENVRSPTQRDKLESWLTKTVLKLGAADDSLDLFYIGTLLHYDSVLARTLKNPWWKTFTFRALLQWPDRMDLWEQWEDQFRTQGEEAADRFYAQRRGDGRRGAGELAGATAVAGADEDSRARRSRRLRRRVAERPGRPGYRAVSRVCVLDR